METALQGHGLKKENRVRHCLVAVSMRYDHRVNVFFIVIFFCLALLRLSGR